MKQLLITIAAVVLVGCGESQQSAPALETEPTEPLAEVAKPEPPTAKAPDISIVGAAGNGNIEAVKQHIAAGADVNAMHNSRTPLYWAALFGHKEIAEVLISAGANVNAKEVMATGNTPLAGAAFFGDKAVAELLIANGADVNTKNDHGKTPLDLIRRRHPEIADLLRKHGGKTSAELKAAGN